MQKFATIANMAEMIGNWSRPAKISLVEARKEINFLVIAQIMLNEKKIEIFVEK